MCVTNYKRTIKELLMTRHIKGCVKLPISRGHLLQNLKDHYKMNTFEFLGMFCWTKPTENTTTLFPAILYSDDNNKAEVELTD